MREKGMDYFENSRRVTYVQQQYAIHNPRRFKDYGSCCWGITASEGPGPGTIKINGIDQQLFDYVGRGVPYGPDDGTLVTESGLCTCFQSNVQAADERAHKFPIHTKRRENQNQKMLATTTKKET